MMTQLHDSCMSHQRDQYWHNNWDLRGKRKFIDDSFMRNCHWIATLVLKFFVQRKMNLKMQRLMVNIMHIICSWTWKIQNFFLKIFEISNGIAILFCCSKNRIFTVTLECIIIFSSNSNLAYSLKNFGKKIFKGSARSLSYGAHLRNQNCM